MGGKLQLIKHINEKIEFFEKLNDCVSVEYNLLRQHYLSLPKSQKRISLREESLEILQFQKILLEEWKKAIEIKKSLLREQQILIRIYYNHD
jgi:hypothetical protein